MFAFVYAEGMAEAGGGGQTRKTGTAGTAILAIVLGFFVSLIQRVLAFVRSSRMTETGCSRQAGNAGGFVSAILAVVVHGWICVGKILPGSG